MVANAPPPAAPSGSGCPARPPSCAGTTQRLPPAPAAARQTPHPDKPTSPPAPRSTTNARNRTPPKNAAAAARNAAHAWRSAPCAAANGSAADSHASRRPREYWPPDASGWWSRNAPFPAPAPTAPAAPIRAAQPGFGPDYRNRPAVAPAWAQKPRSFAEAAAPAPPLRYPRSAARPRATAPPMARKPPRARVLFESQSACRAVFATRIAETLPMRVVKISIHRTCFTDQNTALSESARHVRRQ